MEAKLVILGGKTNKQQVKLKLPSVIGRSRQADLTVAHPMISRRHCELFEADGLVKIRDLGSLNGTYVHGKKIDQEVILRPNDEFTIGPLTFRIEYEAPETIPQPPPTPVEETPEYIPSFVQPRQAGAAEAASPNLAETPAPKSPPRSPPPLPTGASPWKDLETLEKEFDFDLAEEVAGETPHQIHPAPGVREPSAEQAAEEALAEQLPEAEAVDQAAPSEVAPEIEEALAEESSLETVSEPEEPPSPEKPASVAQEVSAGPSPPPSQEEGLEDLDEIEDAALRDFLKGLR